MFQGQSFTVKCITLEGNGIVGKYTYSWTKNKELLPVKTDSEKFETLYPAGTILQVLRVEVSLLNILGDNLEQFLILKKSGANLNKCFNISG